MKRFVSGIIGIMLLAGIQPVYSQTAEEISSAIEEVRQVLPENDYQVFSDTVHTMYLGEEDAAVQKTAGIFDYAHFIVAAYLYGWVDANIYIWNGTEYEIWPSSELVDLPPWSGFWVRANRDVELYVTPWLEDAAPGVDDTMELTLQQDKYYFIAPPLVPANNNGDIGVNFGDDLGMDSFEDTARISKWNYQSLQYDRYTPSSPLPELLPGRGYWAYQNQDAVKTLDITGSKFSSGLMNLHVCSLSLPEGDHMCGNPFHYDMSLLMLWVKNTNSSGEPIAKVAISDGESLLGSLESWHVDLKLTTPDGSYLDTFNRAGVIESGTDIHETLSAVDMPAMGDNIRLAILNSESDTGMYAFDFRSPGADEYVWDMELSTTLDQIAATLSLENIATVPESYALTLIDDNGAEIPIGADASFTVNLAAAEAQTYQLKATRTNPTVVAEAVIPEAVSITGVSPNPFNPETTISFDLDRPGSVSVKVYSINGQLVANLADGAMEAGSHRLTWDASGQSSGIYLVTVGAHGHSDYQKVTLLK